MTEENRKGNQTTTTNNKTARKNKMLRSTKNKKRKREEAIMKAYMYKMSTIKNTKKKLLGIAYMEIEDDKLFKIFSSLSDSGLVNNKIKNDRINMRHLVSLHENKCSNESGNTYNEYRTDKLTTQTEPALHILSIIYSKTGIEEFFAAVIVNIPGGISGMQSFHDDHLDGNQESVETDSGKFILHFRHEWTKNASRQFSNTRKNQMNKIKNKSVSNDNHSKCSFVANDGSNIKSDVYAIFTDVKKSRFAGLHMERVNYAITTALAKQPSYNIELKMDNFTKQEHANAEYDRVRIFKLISEDVMTKIEEEMKNEDELKDACKKLLDNSPEASIKPSVRMNVVPSDMFEEALFVTDVRNKQLAFTLIFPRDCKMPVTVPVYLHGYINVKDIDEREHNSDYLTNMQYMSNKTSDKNDTKGRRNRE